LAAVGDVGGDGELDGASDQASLADNGLEQTGLARGNRADEHGQLSRVDVETDIVEDGRLGPAALGPAKAAVANLDDGAIVVERWTLLFVGIGREGRFGFGAGR
jgi:hypothetical protein